MLGAAGLLGLFPAEETQLPVRVPVAVGDPAAAIRREAEGEKVLVAVGSRGLGPVKRMRLGSVSTKVLRAAKGPVLVYPLEAI